MNSKTRASDYRNRSNGETANEQVQTPTETDSQSERPVCTECGGRLERDAEHGETACVNCGLVINEDAVDRGPEWRAFDSAERDRKSRVGAPTTEMMHDKGLSTMISPRNRDAHGEMLNSRQRQRMQRLRTWDERFRTRNSRDRNLKQALGEIERMASALGLPETVRETASVIYRRAMDEDLLLGRSIEGVTTASLYAAARQTGTPRTTDAVAAVSRIDELEFKRAYRYTVRELGLEIEPTNPIEHVPRFASELGLSSETEHRARRLLRTAEGQGVYSGKSPAGLAAAGIYAAGLLTDEHVTQSEVSAVSDVTEVTIRNRYQELLEADQAT